MFYLDLHIFNLHVYDKIVEAQYLKEVAPNSSNLEVIFFDSNIDDLY